MGNDHGRLRVEWSPKAIVVGFEDGRIIHLHAVQEMVKELLDLLDRDPGIALILDFSGVNYVSSAFLGSLVKVNKRSNEGSGKLMLCSMSDEIRRLFAITGLDRMVGIYGDRQEALAAAG